MTTNYYVDVIIFPGAILFKQISNFYYLFFLTDVRMCLISQLSCDTTDKILCQLMDLYLYKLYHKFTRYEFYLNSRGSKIFSI